VRRRKGAGEQQATIEIPDPRLERLIFSIQHTGLLRIQLAQNEKIAVLNFLGANASRPLAPMRRHLEQGSRKGRKLRRNLLVGEPGFGTFDVQAKQPIFLVVADPALRSLIIHAGSRL
jgi:hypothetical protein